MHCQFITRFGEGSTIAWRDYFLEEREERGRGERWMDISTTTTRRRESAYIVRVRKLLVLVNQIIIVSSWRKAEGIKYDIRLLWRRCVPSLTHTSCTLTLGTGTTLPGNSSMNYIGKEKERRTFVTPMMLMLGILVSMIGWWDIGYWIRSIYIIR